MADRKLVGKIIETGGEPVAGADLWLSRRGGATTELAAGAAGEFEFDLSDAEAWPEGAVTLSVRAPDSPLTESRTLQLPASGSPSHQVLKVHAKDEISATSGWLFLGFTIAFLGLLSVFYLDLHGVTVDKIRGRDASVTVERTDQLSSPLADMLKTAKAQVASARDALAAATGPTDAVEVEPVELADVESDAVEGESEGESPAGESPAGESPADEADETEPDEAEPSADESENPARQALQDAMVDDSLETAKEIFAALVETRAGLLADDRVSLIDGLFGQAEAALDAGAVEALDATLDRLLEQMEDERSVFLWQEAPGRLLEIMFWALAATLLRLIFNAGYYLYKSCFLKTAIPHHLALMVIIPVVAVIISFVLTLFRVDLQLGENVLTLDMSNVLVSILVACLIGLSPWESWRFLHRLADRFFKALASYFNAQPSSESTEQG